MISHPRAAAGAAIAVLAAASSACALAEWNCLRQQHRGDVVALSGEVSVGEKLTHVVPYDQQGDQNDVVIRWTPSVAGGGPRIHAYATSMDCAEFQPPISGARTVRSPTPLPPHHPPPVIYPKSPCAEIGSRAFMRLASGELVQTSIVVPGGPNQRRPWLRQYKLHVISNSAAPASYSISITWFRGPDC